MKRPKTITDDTFEQQVLQADRPVLVDFWAEWCGPCKMIAPILEKVAQERAEDLTVAKLDVDANQHWALHFGVMGIPTMLLFKEGEVVDRITGFLPKDRFLARLEPHLN